MITKSKKITNKKIFILMGIILFYIICMNFILYYLLAPQKIIKYKMYLIIGDHIGFDINNESINFGMIPHSSLSVRHINLNNGKEISKVRITASGDLADWITVSDNNFLLQPHEYKTLDIIAKVPSDKDFGKYQGNLKINFLKNGK